METISNKQCVSVVENLIHIINTNKQTLSDIDGLIGDGDHGVNMSKGFTRAGEQINPAVHNFSEAIQLLGTVLVNEIGGAMGPLYGTLFNSLGKASRGHDTIDKHIFGQMLALATEKVQTLGDAKVGDKTMIDVLVPAHLAYQKALDGGANFHEALNQMKQAAEKGRDSTKDLVAKKGRASRLGERSRGTLDAGATSCCLILISIADTMQKLLSGE